MALAIAEGIPEAAQLVESAGRQQSADSKAIVAYFERAHVSDRLAASSVALFDVSCLHWATDGATHGTDGAVNWSDDTVTHQNYQRAVIPDCGTTKISINRKCRNWTKWSPWRRLRHSWTGNWLRIRRRHGIHF